MSGRPDLKERFSNSFHRNIYPRVTFVAAKLTDFNFPVSDVLTQPVSSYAYEILGLAAILVGTSVATGHEVPLANIAMQYIGLSFLLNMAETGFFDLNKWRTPIEDKMDLKITEDFPLGKELSYVIHEINKRLEVERIEGPQLTPMINEAVDNVMVKYDGYLVPSTKRAKKTAFGKLQLWKMHGAAQAHPLFQELIVSDERMPATQAHELFQLKGIVGEDSAQFLGVVSLIESGNPYLEYLGYRQWLDFLVDHMQIQWNNPNASLNQLEDRGLNQRTLQEMYDEADYIHEVLNGTMSYSRAISKLAHAINGRLPTNMRRNISPQFLKWCHQFEPSLYGFINNRVQSSHRDDETADRAYIELPLQLLHAYRRQYLQPERYQS